jgi:hypothetical protein
MAIFNDPYNAFDALEQVCEESELHAEHIKNMFKHITYQKKLIDDLNHNVGTLAQNLASVCEILTALKKQVNNTV